MGSIDLVKIGLGPKLQKGQYLKGWIVFYFVRGIKSQLLNTFRPKVLLSLQTTLIYFIRFASLSFNSVTNKHTKYEFASSSSPPSIPLTRFIIFFNLFHRKHSY